MRGAYTFILFLLLFNLSGQVMMNMRIKLDSVTVKKYEPDETDFKYKEIHIQPGDYRIVNTAIPRILNQETITQVDLVYSDYPEGEDFTELNRKRLIELYMHCPNAFNKQVITWRVVKQTGLHSAYDLHKFFHGFVVYYRPLIPFYTERKHFEDVLAGKEKLQDSTILKVLTRNTHWKEMLCVADVTGSMSPYTVQLLVWAKFNEKLKTFKQFVFFNDDEEKSNDQTVKQDTSGIWSIETFKSEKIFDKIIYSMEKGQHIENDLEAIFYAVKLYKDNVKNIVLIADNWEDPCDMNLLPKLKELKIPIRVVLCGVNSVVNTKYLDIAYATNGSLHTMEEDLVEMGKMNEGKTFTISGLKFKLINGKFVPVNQNK
jgi:hypothetical protein